jgi:hypothetical protein
MKNSWTVDHGRRGTAIPRNGQAVVDASSWSTGDSVFLASHGFRISRAYAPVAVLPTMDTSGSQTRLQVPTPI